jgi:hypothetical protein
MTTHSSNLTPNLKQVLRAGLMAGAIMLLLTLSLRPTGLPRGIRMGTVWFVFMLLNSFLLDKAVGRRRSRMSWLTFVVLALVFSVAMGLVGELDA